MVSSVTGISSPLRSLSISVIAVLRWLLGLYVYPFMAIPMTSFSKVSFSRVPSGCSSLYVSSALNGNLENFGAAHLIAFAGVKNLACPYNLSACVASDGHMHGSFLLRMARLISSAAWFSSFVSGRAPFGFSPQQSSCSSFSLQRSLFSHSLIFAGSTLISLNLHLELDGGPVVAGL